MTLRHYVKSHLWYVCRIAQYRRVYKNYFNVILNHRKNKYPFNVTLANGEELILNNRLDNYTVLFSLKKCYKVNNNEIIFSKDDLPSVKLRDWITNGDVFGIFLKDNYSFLPVKGKMVLDIGANIADSSIYFAIKGAKKIIALEPLPKNYESAKKNIEINNLSDKIELLLAGCSSKSGNMLVDSQVKGGNRSLHESKKGIEVPLLTLDDILNTYDIKTALLKVDCEGCEYEIIKSSSAETLRNFTHIQIEYHFGYKNLKEKLEKCGFKVSVSNPYLMINTKQRKFTYVGYLYAFQK